MRSKVNIESNFSKTIVERVFDESEFMLRNNEILRTTALKFNVSVTTVWKDMRKRLPLINPEQYKKISGLIYSHKKGQKGYRIYGFIGDD